MEKRKSLNIEFYNLTICYILTVLRKLFVTSIYPSTQARK